MAFVRREIKKDSANLFAIVFSVVVGLFMLVSVLFSSKDTARLTPALVLPLAARFTNAGPTGSAASK